MSRHSTAVIDRSGVLRPRDIAAHHQTAPRHEVMMMDSTTAYRSKRNMKLTANLVLLPRTAIADRLHYVGTDRERSVSCLA
jgi:hypothetical protein